MRRIILKGFVLAFTVSLMSFSACMKPEFPETIYSDDLEEVLVSDDFDWKIKSEKTIEITVPYNEVVTIKSSDESFIYSKGMPKDNVFKRKITVESFTETILVEYLGKVNTIPITAGDKIEHTFMVFKSALTNDNLVDNGDFEDVNYNYEDENNLQSNISSSDLDIWVLKSWQNNKPNSQIATVSNNEVMKMTDNKTNKFTFAYYYILGTPNTEYVLQVDADLVDDEDDLEPYVELAFFSSNGQEIIGYDIEVDQSGWNTYTITQTSPVNVAYIKVVLATTNSGKGEVHFDNVLLTEAAADADADGIADDDDAYPNDATRAFNSYYPAGGNGLIAFEDTWPAKADYDFNDLVLNYRFTVVTNADGYVVELIGNFVIDNIGAGYTNGFGFQLPGNSASWYSSVSGVVNNSFEAGQTYPTVMLYSVSDYSYEGLTYQTVFTLNSNVADEMDIFIDGWNPFLTAQGVRAHEIHLPYYEPTDLADLTLFGTNYDDGNPNAWNGNKLVSAKSYLTASNLPWAIDVTQDFVWTVERTPINDGYNFFTTWATTSGQSYSDWYLPSGSSGTETNYRNVSNLAL